MPSIHDVAKMAGVSISTVSRVLNNSTNVSEKKKKAVLEAMEKLDYEPSQFGRGLVKQTTNLIGVYFPYTDCSIFDNEYYLELLKGIEEILTERQYGLVLISENRHYQESTRMKPCFLEYIRQKRIDGLIISGLSEKNVKDNVLSSIMNDNYPAVYIGKKFHEKGLNIYAQLELYSAQMIENMIDHGHRKIIFLCTELMKRYEDNIRNTIYSKYSDITLKMIYLNRKNVLHKQIRDILEYDIIRDKYTAVCVPEMEVARIVALTCHELGISFPEHFSLLAVEHKPGSGEIIYPGVTSYLVPSKEMGRGAARLLLDNLQNRTCESTTIEYKTKYVKRKSIRHI